MRHEGPIQEVSKIREKVLNWVKDNKIKISNHYSVKYLTHPCAVGYERMVYDVGISIDNKKDNSIKIIEYPKHKALSVMHNGSYDGLKEVHEFLVDYAKKMGYKPFDYIEDIYYRRSDEVAEKDLLTEVQLPIRM